MTTEEMIEALGEDAFPITFTATLDKDGMFSHIVTDKDGNEYKEPDDLKHLLVYRALAVGLLKDWAKEIEDDTYEFMKELREAIARAKED